MNDIEKAIENLKMENELMQFDPNTGEDYPIELQNQDNQDLYKANLIAILALEKQIPEKPLEKQLNVNHDLIGLCPICKVMWCIKYKEYCANCGQKLDWSEAANEM